MTTRRRVRLARGIYEDQFGRAGVVTVGTGPLRQGKEKRFPPGTEIRTIRAWQDETRVALRATQPLKPSGFALDVAAYLETVRTMPSYQDRAHDLALWVQVFGTRDRHAVTALDVQAQLDSWRAAGCAASTVNHRRSALRRFYRMQADDYNPVIKTRRYREPDALPRGLKYPLIARLLRTMPNMGRAEKGEERPPVNLTKLRLAVIAHTGLPHAALMQLRPEMIDWRRKRLLFPARSKGEGAKPRTVPLTKEGLAALRAFAAADAWGRFSTASMRASFLRACRRLGLSGLRPYDLRHAFGSAVWAATGSLQTTGYLMGHAPGSLRTTARYTLSEVPKAAEAAAKAVSERMALQDGTTTARRANLLNLKARARSSGG